MAKNRSCSKLQGKNENPKKSIDQKKPHRQQQQQKPHSWAAVRSLFSCKHLQTQMREPQRLPEVVHKEEEKKEPKQEHVGFEESNKKCKKMKCGSSSICSNTKVMHRQEINEHASSSSRSIKVTLNDINGTVVSTSSSSSSGSIMSAASANSASTSIAGSFRGGIFPFRKLSGCYECRMVVDPVLGVTRDLSLRSTICSCPECGEIFMKAENLEVHQAVRHAVSELGPEDTSKNIVEIIFQSSWQGQQTPVCKIDRILKIHNTSRTVSRFEAYRETIKAKATNHSKKHPRCVADGNELLRFYCTTLVCSLGLNGSSNLCNSIPNCNVCSIIKHGFKISGDVDGEGVLAGKGILTTATSGRAHDNARINGEEDDKRAMLVCRVIAGRVKRSMEGCLEEYDSVSGASGMYSNLDELFVDNPRAILPCFVVIYRGF